MAQEPRLIAFEQALKDEGIAGTQLESFARSIFQQESSSGKNIQTSNAGARGPMQVLPTTFKAYNPQGNIDNPYDNIVGGIRYIKDLFSKTNDLNLTAVGYYGGPKAIEKAKQGVAVRDPRNPNAPDTLQYASQVTSRSAPAPETKSNSSPVNKTIRQEIANLGTSYQAALALMAKADSTSSKAREKIAEEDDFLGMGNDGSQAKKMFQQVTFTSPFATKKTKKMKSGGEVKAQEKKEIEQQGFNPFFDLTTLDRPENKKQDLPYYMPANQGVAGKIGAEYQGESGKYRGGASAVAIKLPDGSIKFIPSTYEAGYRAKIGPGELDINANRSIKAAPGRSPEFGVSAKYLYKFANGGDVEQAEPSTGEKVKGTAKEILRSTQYTPYDLLGAPVDVLNLGLKGVDYLTGSKLATERPVGGSDYLIEKSRQLGIADKPTGSLTETLTRLGTGIASPTAGPRAVVAAGKAVKGTAKAALEDLAMAGTGQGGSKLSQQIMAPGAAFAVRPKGGVYLGAKSIDEPPLSNFDVDIKRLVEGLDKTNPKEAEILNFFDKKVRNYVMNQQGTVDDPIFKKLLSGEIPNFTFATDANIAAARAGDKVALKDVRDAYDASLSITGYVRQGFNARSGDLSAVEKSLKKNIQEQSPDNFITDSLVSASYLTPKDLKSYPALFNAPGFSDFVKETQAQGPLAQLLNKSNLPPHIRRAIAEKEPVFASTKLGAGRAIDTRQLRDYLSTRTANEIKNMGVADANTKSLEWHDLIAKATTGAKNFSKNQLFAGTEPLLKLKDEYSWVDVKTREALVIEGCIMGHCVGKSPQYLEGVMNGTKKIYSLRDKKGAPHVTMEIIKTNQVPMVNWDGSIRQIVDPNKKDVFNGIAQIKGKADRPAESYFPQIEEFLTNYSSKVGDLDIQEYSQFVPKNWRSE